VYTGGSKEWSEMKNELHSDGMGGKQTYPPFKNKTKDPKATSKSR